MVLAGLDNARGRNRKLLYLPAVGLLAATNLLSAYAMVEIGILFLSLAGRSFSTDYRKMYAFSLFSMMVDLVRGPSRRCPG